MSPPAAAMHSTAGKLDAVAHMHTQMNRHSGPQHHGRLVLVVPLRACHSVRTHIAFNEILAKHIP